MAEDIRRLSALMITSMVGSTRLLQRDEAFASRLLEEHNGVLGDSVSVHKGRAVVESPRALQAISCSIDDGPLRRRPAR